jgi:two-component system, response regulator PdtaR
LGSLASQRVSYRSHVVSDLSQKCPEWDSNPHYMVFETISSTGWDIGASAPDWLTRQRSHDNLPLDGSLLGVSQNALRVVIAEDEALIRLDLKEMLEEEGYSVVAEAADGEAAIEKVLSHRPDLAIFDVKMPILDGISAAERIAGERIAPVVILTAFSQRELVERARDAGAMAYLVKPFTKADLVPAIEMAVSRYQEIRALDQEVNTLKDRLEVRKLLDRAKGLLQSEHGMTEPQAFRWIQKTSMDRRLTMRKVAEAVIEGTLSASAQPDENPE